MIYRKETFRKMIVLIEAAIGIRILVKRVTRSPKRPNLQGMFYLTDEERNKMGSTLYLIFANDLGNGMVQLYDTRGWGIHSFKAVGARPNNKGGWSGGMKYTHLLEQHINTVDNILTRNKVKPIIIPDIQSDPEENALTLDEASEIHNAISTLIEAYKYVGGLKMAKSAST